MSLQINEALLLMVERRASDLHIAAGAPPTIRVRGRLQALEDYPVLTETDTREALYGILRDDQRKRFENDLQLDFAYMITGQGRFRVNVYRQRAAIGAAFR